MSGTDCNFKIVRDSRINDITTQCTYGVHKGASNSSFQSFPSISASETMISCVIQVPSENIVLDRSVLVDTDINFQINITKVASGSKAFSYGENDSLQCFPFNSLVQNMNCAINDTQLAVQLQDILAPLIRLNDTKDLYKWNGMTPSLPDQGFRNYHDMLTHPQNPLGDYTNSSYDVNLIPRGAHPMTMTIRHYKAAAPTVAVLNSLVSTDENDRWEIDCSVHVTEPLIGLSPFLFGRPINNQGFVGINGLNLTFNIDSTLKRFFSTAKDESSDLKTMSIKLSSTPFPNFKILCNFLNAQPSDLINPKNVVPYVSFPVYKTTNQITLAKGQKETFTSQTVQLSQIPDYFIIFARKPINQQTIRDSSSFLAIKKIDITFNNVSGLLSGASEQDLWRMSVKNGSTQNYYEFHGEANRKGEKVATTGSLLMLNPVIDFGVADYLSSGSIGQYSIQYTVQLVNPDDATFSPELVLIAVNSGIFTTVSGQSSIKTGLLTKELVMSITENETSNTASSGIVSEMQGGNMHNKFNSNFKRLPGDVIKLSKGGAYSAGGFVAGSLADMC